MPPFDCDGVIDSLTGIVRWVADLPIDPGEPEIFNCSVKMADTGVYQPLRCFDRNGGAGLTRQAARRAAVGEAVERYCASACFPDQLSLGSYREVSQSTRACGPDDLALFHPRQHDCIRYPAFTDDLPITWVAARSQATGQSVLVPACLTFSPYFPFLRERGEQTIGPSITTGLASAFSFAEAVLRGACEIIERDAFMITWLNRLPVPRIDIESSPRLTQVFRERFKRDYLSWSLHRLATDVPIPCILCVVVDHSRDPPMVCTGGAANLDPERAALKAIIEAAQTREWAKYLGHQPVPFSFESDWSNVNDFDKHVLLYAYGDMSGAVEFLRSAPAVCGVADLGGSTAAEGEAGLELVSATVSDLGAELLAVDLTTPDVASCGYSVVKAFIPGMQQLEGDHSHRLLGGRRLYDVPHRVGFDISPSFDSLNPDPHPYP
jgi:ribosomal protein S12 methylthiotransferase accessory factor